MKIKRSLPALALGLIAWLVFSFQRNDQATSYQQLYKQRLKSLIDHQTRVLVNLTDAIRLDGTTRSQIQTQISVLRRDLKQFDFWARYLDPISYKQLNGPLPVEWETEVFEKFEKPYQRRGAGLTLAILYLDENNPHKDSLIQLITCARDASRHYENDSLTEQLQQHHHFFLCNRLFLLNLAAIYTTGFECPEPERIIPELQLLLTGTAEIYRSYQQSFPEFPLSEDYLNLFEATINFCNRQPLNFETFDHYRFLRDYVNPLFAINQGFIRNYKVSSKSYVDYSLNKTANSIFSKKLYSGQNAKGIFLRVYDQEVLAEIEDLGRKLFYDPILSGNNMRSCASCHKPEHYLSDTSAPSPLHFNRQLRLPRNAPSLVNANYNHLIMLDGHHIGLQDQALAVITNSAEMCGDKDVTLKKVLSCNDYKRSLQRLLKHTPQYEKISIDHLSSALTFYYSKFSSSLAPFDEAMNKKTELSPEEQKGFNLFMSKAQCATCHFVPQFNGVKPPYVGSEFEVLGVPADLNYTAVSNDLGRYSVNPAKETANAFRTGSLRNIERTAPYMHNGVFRSLEEVVDFYDGGGGAGRGLQVPNQTLSSDSLHLSSEEKKQLILFMKCLTENIQFDAVPTTLPTSKMKALNTRKVRGEY